MCAKDDSAWYTEDVVKLAFQSDAWKAGEKYLKTTVLRDKSSALAKKFADEKPKSSAMMARMGLLQDPAMEDWDSSFEELLDEALDLKSTDRIGDFYWKVIVQEAVWLMHSVVEKYTMTQAMTAVAAMGPW